MRSLTFMFIVMDYRLLLTNTADGEQRKIIVPDRLFLEDLSPKLKVQFQLPLCDYGWHRFLAHGTAYVIEEYLVAEPEILFECFLYVGKYSCSERVRLRQVFTVLGSTVTYIQEENGFNKHKIRVTLLERL